MILVWSYITRRKGGHAVVMNGFFVAMIDHCSLALIDWDNEPSSPA